MDFIAGTISLANIFASRISQRASVAHGILRPQSYFLLENPDFSVFHRISRDEIWHLYAGALLIVHEIDLHGKYRKTRLGIDWRQNERPQAIIPAGRLFGASMSEAGGFALLGCTVAPGFEFGDFELPERADLLRRDPQHRTIIESLTRTG